MKHELLRAGIFAAGNGARLRPAGACKPLVEVSGRALIKHVLDSFAESGVSEVTILINEDSRAVRAAVEESAWPFDVRWIVQTTPSSMHSFLLLVETLAADGNEGPFLLSTVDTVLPAGAAAEFFLHAGRDPAAVVLAVNTPAEDDNPLWVRCAPGEERVVALDEAASDSPLATAGLYCVRASILAEAEAARRENVSSLRQYLGRLLACGHRISARAIPNSIDVDQPRDIIAAEKLMSGILQ